MYKYLVIPCYSITYTLLYVILIVGYVTLSVDSFGAGQSALCHFGLVKIQFRKHSGIVKIHFRKHLKPVDLIILLMTIY